MKKIFTTALALLLLIAPKVALSQEELTVYDGTATNGYVPIYGFYSDAYLKAEMVYPAGELVEMDGATINSMTFYASQVNVNWGTTFRVFLMEVVDETISAFVGPGTIVYEGQLVIAGNEMIVEFTTPYEYNGGNLLVGFYQTNTGTYITSSWYGVNVNDASVQGYSYNGLDAISATQRDFLPKTTFGFTPGGNNTCEKPATIEANNVTAHSVELGWTGGSGIYDVEYKRIGNNHWLNYANSLSDTTITISNLIHATDYQVRVRSVCNDGVSGWKVLSFSTDVINYDHIYVTENGMGDGGTWETATKDLQWALYAAERIRNTYGTATVVWVAAGTYYGDTTAVNAFTMVEGVDVYGGFAGNEPADYDMTLRDFAANATVLDGRNERRVLYQPTSFNTITTWNGVTIQHGQISGAGGGAYLNNKGRITQCVIKDNSAYDGGGIYCNYNAIVSDCQVSNNTASSYGGGVYAYGANVYNCLIANNTADYSGGGVYCYYASLTNSTIVRNEANNGAGVYGNYGGVVTNCIMWGNGSNEINNVSGTITCSYSAIEGGFEGGDHVMVLSSNNHGPANNPWFVSPDNDDYRLQSNSCLINAGNSSIDLSNTDIANAVRVYDDTVDIGCYEYHDEAYCLAPISLEVQDVTGRSAMLAWQNPDPHNSFYYELSYKMVNETEWAVVDSVQEGFYLLTGLEPQTVYRVRVRTSCGAGVFSYYTEMHFTTRCSSGTIGETTTSTNGGVLPTNIYYKYSYTQQIYQTAEIGEAILIDSLYLQYFHEIAQNRNVNIYLGHTSKTTFTSNNDWIPLADLTLVFSGSITFNNSGENYWFNIPLETPFEYNGVDNLVLAFDDNTGSYSSSGNRFYTHSTADNTSMYVYSDGTNYNPDNPGNGNRISYRNNLRLSGNCIDDSCLRTVMIAVTDITDSSALLLLDFDNDTLNYVLEIKEVENDTYTVLTPTGDSYLLTGLRQNTQYEVRVRTACNNSYSSWKRKLFTTGVANYDRLYVTENGTGDGGSWQTATNDLRWALNTAQRIKSAYGTIPVVWVAGGTYYGDVTSNNAFTMVEGVNVYGGFVGNEPADYNLSQRNIDGNATVLDGQNSRRVLYQPSSFNLTTIWDGFTIRNGYTTGNGGGVYLNSKGKLSHSIITNNYAFYGGGVYAYYNSRISSCLVSNNTAYNNGGGVYNYSANVNNSTIVRNTANSGAGIYGSSGGDVTNCIVWGNGTDEINNIAGNMSCSHSAISGGFLGEHNILLSEHLGQEPLFAYPSQNSGADANSDSTDWRLLQGSPCINRGNNTAVTDSFDLDGMARIQRDTVDMGCYESDYYSSPILAPQYTGIVYVTQSGSGTQTGESWANATSSMSFALSVARAYHADVWIAAGTYYGDTTATSAFTMVEGVDVYGGFAGNEPADYDLALRDFDVNTTVLDGRNERRVLYQPSSFNTTTTWNGLTIQHGQTSGNGGGANLNNKGNITQCVVKENSAYSGAGVYAYYATVSNCRISNNIANSYAGGVYAYNNSTVSCCQISNNKATYGGGVYAYSSSSTIRNCLISNNTANNYGGGVYNSYYATVKNSTIVRNVANSGAGIYGSSGGNVTNCIVWGNGTDEINNIAGNMSCSHSAISGGFLGEHNILLSEHLGQEPLFAYPSQNSGADANSDSTDWRLLQGSPCINRGDNSIVTDSFDLDGMARIQRDTVDMGCYESDYYSSPILAPEYTNIIYVTQGGAGNQTGESWDNATSSLSFALAVARTFNANVWVAAGIYYGDTSETAQNAFIMVDGVNVYGGFAGNELADYDLNLRDYETNATILDGQNVRRVLYQPSSFNTQTTWDGFMIQNGNAPNDGNGGGAYLRYNGVINHCTLQNNHARGGGGIYASNNASVYNCVVMGNTCLYAGGGVFAESGAIISHAAITGNQGGTIGGIYINAYPSTRALVTNCLIANNTGCGLYSRYGLCKNTTILNNYSLTYAGVSGNNSEFVNCIVWGNKGRGPIIIEGENMSVAYSAVEGGVDGEHNVLLNELNPPLFVNPSLIAGASGNTASVDWHLQAGSVCINRGNNDMITDSLDLEGTIRVKRDTVDLGCYESDYYSTPAITPDYSNIIYVTENGAGNMTGESWSDATSSISFATTMAKIYHAAVWVAAGVYYGDTTAANAFTMVDGVDVYGGFAGNEPDDYDLSQRDFEVNATILDGQNARRVLYQPYVFNDTTTTWDGFTIRNGRYYNTDDYYQRYGGGVYLWNGVLRKCVVKNNHADRYGGGIYISSDAKLLGCEISHNYSPYGGGIYVEFYRDSYGYIVYPSVNIINSLISNNDGGGVCAHYGKLSLLNSTIVCNSSSGVYDDSYDYGVHFNPTFDNDAICELMNCVVWGNKGRYGLKNLSEGISCSYSAIEGGYEGDSIITLSAENPPLFVNPSLTAGTLDTTANVDWHLQQGSPCINRGNNDAVSDSIDLDGNPRIKYDTVDMGCYEFQGSQIIPIGDGQPCTDAPTVTDYDEVVYNTVKIGNQCWMKENLRTTHYSDGTIIPLGGYSSSMPYRYCPDNNCDNVSAYGYLYNWSAVMYGAGSSNENPSGVQGVCPSGWHVPSAVEWTQLLDYVKAQSAYLCGDDSNNIAKALAKTLGWTPTQTECAVGNDVGQNNITGFGAMPAGNYYGPYDNFNGVAFFWTASDTAILPNYNTYSSDPYPIYYAINQCCSGVESHTENKAQGFSVRCLKNDSLISDYFGIIYVTPSGAGTHSGNSWANATSSIDSAQTLAEEHNAVVWVAAGTYYGDTTAVNAFTMHDGVSVYGGFAGDEPEDYDLSLRDFETNETVLDGQNTRRVLCQQTDFNTETTWDGFTIRNGRTLSSGSQPATCGGGVLLKNANLSNCNVKNNYAYSDGGGIYEWCSSSIIRNCKVVNNYAAVYGGGIYVVIYNPVLISNCLVSNNKANYGGGGICSWHGNSYLNVINTTIVNNVGGAGVYSSGPSNYHNCIVWGNSSSFSGNVNCTYSAVQGGRSGEGNINLSSQNTGDGNHPFFVNPTQGMGTSYSGGDWHLMENSACVNKGSNAAVIDSLDLDGKERIMRGIVDMGCYEFAPVDDSVFVEVHSNNAVWGSVTGSGLYFIGDTVTIQATPNLHARFVRWNDNDTTNPRYVIAESDTTYVAIFELYLPELHVTSISHSELIGGTSATVTWAVQNDGTAPTPNGEVWYDRLWLSLEPKVDVNNSNPIYLGEFQNIAALAPGEYYTQTKNVWIPLEISGDYYLFVISDAYDADQIFWDSVVPIPYNPPAYIHALSHNCYGENCGNYAGNRILEMSEYENYASYPYYHDNFFYEQVDITMCPLPDLIVTSVSPATQNFFSGSEVMLTYQVVNDGDYNTRVADWYDMVFISNHDVFDDTAQLLKTIPRTNAIRKRIPDPNPHTPVAPVNSNQKGASEGIIINNDSIDIIVYQGPLDPDSSYQRTFSVNVPLEMYGTAYFYVYTDYYNQVYEHVGQFNNVTRSDSVNIYLTPPADLVPQNIMADNTVSTGATFNYSYEIHNQGAGNPNQSAWNDRCYLSTSADSMVNAIEISVDHHSGGSFPAGGYYSIQKSITLPPNIMSGTYYLFVLTDANNNVFEYLYEDNNLSKYSQPISVVQPDLQILSLNVEDTLSAGSEVGVSYLLANTGDGAIINRNVKDGFYLSQSPDGTNAISLPQFTSNTWLNAHDSTMKYQNVMIPGNLQDGNYYFLVRTNLDNALNETSTGNNISPIQQVYVVHRPLPDLVITSVSLPDTIVAGSSTNFTAVLTNQGDKAINLNLVDYRLTVAAANNNINCPIDSTNTATLSLAAGATTTVNLTATLSPSVSANPSSFTLTVNPNHSVVESNYSNNGYAFTHAVQPYPFDMAVTHLASQDQTISGEYIPVEWTVENIGYAVSNVSLWYDRIYLSTDSLFDANDIQIGSYTRNQLLNAGDSYTVSTNYQIPVAADGDYYILAVCDATQETFDCLRTNNVRGRPISVTQSTLPDLQMDSLMVNNTLTTGQACMIHFSVSNEGEHITHNDRWTDAFYLNNQPTLNNAVLLGSKIHNDQLDILDQYTDYISVIIPNTWIGNCYLMGFTDATDQVVEMNSDSNNLFILPVSVARPLPSDLTVLPPDFPDSAIVGENIEVSWTLRNIGLNAAQGNIKDAVYLSTDSVWSSDDIMLGSMEHDVNLAANGQELRNTSLTLQGVPVGNYYVIVKTNILNALNENSYTNNRVASLTTLHVDYPSLYINQEEQLQMESSQTVYYKLEVGPEYEHQTLSCKLTSPNQNVMNSLYVAYSSAPSTSIFNWSATMPYVQEQEILIPSLEQGTYYIMAKGHTTDNSVQSVTLLAAIINFEIISVNANSGTNTGSVTTQIIGAKFDTIMDFRLANSNSYLPAEKVFFHNSTESYATFNLRDQETGVYDMVAELPGGIITVKGQAFVVEQGLPAELLSNIIAPASVRNGNTFTVTIEYGNNGSTDLNISGFLLVSTNGFPIAFSSDSLANNATELTFETGEPNGNPDVIRPGYFANKTVFVKANRVGNINLKLYPIRRQY